MQNQLSRFSRAEKGDVVVVLELGGEKSNNDFN